MLMNYYVWKGCLNAFYKYGYVNLHISLLVTFDCKYIITCVPHFVIYIQTGLNVSFVVVFIYYTFALFFPFY